ncbi:MAG: hypothetical protein ACI4DN_03400 [Lachnospiraceae bacterium]
MKIGKIIIGLCLGITMILCCVLFRGNRVLAEDTIVGGKGNLTMDGENIKFYSDDIHYLKTEIEKLLTECK